MNGLSSQMDKLYKQNRFHDIVFVLQYKYVPAHKKQLVVLGEQWEIIGELGE
jgi:hypothetical protein